MIPGIVRVATLMTLTLVAADALAQPTEPATRYKAAIQQLRSAIQYEMETKDLPAFSISLVSKEKVIWSSGFGFLDADKQHPANADTIYRVGSVSKLFTDIAVMQLVEKGKVKLDEPVSKYLPDFKPENPFGNSFTVRQLMSHMSGLVREPPVGHYFDPDEPDLQATIASLNQTRLVYKPGTRTKYSNAAVSVVGGVLEKSGGAAWTEQIRERILAPMKMESSSFVVVPKIKDRLATGWMRTYDGRRFEAPTFPLGTAPAGNMYSSVNDLAQLLVCIFQQGKFQSNVILQPKSLKEMISPAPGPGDKPLPFGLGFHIQKLDGMEKIGHGGAIYGFSTQVEALPEKKVGAAAVASLDGSNGVVGRLVDYALRLMVAVEENKSLPDYPRTTEIPTERARRIAGSFREEGGKRTAKITEWNGKTFLRRGAFRYDLRATAAGGTLIADDPIGYGLKVEFQSDDRLKIDGVSYQRLRDIPASARKEWKGLIGEYGWDHNVLYILEDRGQLYALIEWFFYYPLKQIDNNTFAFPDYGLYHGEKLIFKRDSAGKGAEVLAAEVRFKRRELGTVEGKTFQIKPVSPIDELRGVARKASVPKETGEFRKPELTEVVSLAPDIKLDIRYATDNNFTGAVFYKQPRAFMQKPAAEAVKRVQQKLKSKGLGLLIHDAYRPWYVTKMFWDATPENLKHFVANPASGSRHNRGCAVDLTLCERESGKPIPMGAGYDEFSPRSYALYPGGTARQRWYRELLRTTMESEGFTIYEYEWWHFDYKDWKKYRIGNQTFEQILGDKAGE